MNDRHTCTNCDRAMFVSTKDKRRAPVLIVCTHANSRTIDGAYTLAMHQRMANHDGACGVDAINYTPREID